MNAVRNVTEFPDGTVLAEFWTIPLDGRVAYCGGEAHFPNRREWQTALDSCRAKGWLIRPSDRDIAEAILAAGGIVPRCSCQEIAADPYECAIHGAKLRAARIARELMEQVRASMPVSAYHNDAEGRWCGGAES